MKTNRKVYVHKGSSNFDKTVFREITNAPIWVKPLGGLWASPEESDYGWEQWTQDNDFMTDKYVDEFRFTLRPDAKVLYINSAEDLDDLPKIKPEIETTWVTLDFAKLKDMYDAIEVLISADNRLYWLLYGWDCDSLLVMNPDVVEQI